MFLMVGSTKKGGSLMIDNLIIDLISDIDLRFLNNMYIEEDLNNQQSILSTIIAKRMSLNKNGKFEISDSLRTAIMEQNERNDEPDVRRMFDIKVVAVKNKFKTMFRIASGIVAMLVLMISIIAFLIKKKSSGKLTRKKFPAAC